LAEVAKSLRFSGESVKVIVGRLDFDDSALGILDWRWLGCARSARGLRKEAAVGNACAGVAELGGEEDGGL
jgi:hypothetical protein